MPTRRSFLTAATALVASWAFWREARPIRAATEAGALTGRPRSSSPDTDFRRYLRQATSAQGVGVVNTSNPA